MKLCKDCANVYDSGPLYDCADVYDSGPLYDCADVYDLRPLYACTAAATYDLVTGHKNLPRAIDVRRDPGLCGLDGAWFAERVEQAVVEPKKPEGPKNVLVPSPERTFLQKLKDLFA